ncbi:MAG: flavodoxin, partial [Eggerthellaceae bacterium]|nr:flavodoxin [Eggerthellaceae bacterium]
IETIKEYDANYYACIEDAKAELQADARPEVKRYLEDAGLSMDDYDTIFLGYPNWWGTCPMCVFTFLDHYNLAGKRIVPFCTNEGSGMGGSEKHLKKLYPDAIFEAGLFIMGNQAAQSQDKTAAWAKKFA